jgi:hypothetical protein
VAPSSLLKLATDESASELQTKGATSSATGDGVQCDDAIAGESSNCLMGRKEPEHSANG